MLRTQDAGFHLGQDPLNVLDVVLGQFQALDLICPWIFPGMWEISTEVCLVE
jgi:hypothetical protein